MRFFLLIAVISLSSSAMGRPRAHHHHSHAHHQHSHANTHAHLELEVGAGAYGWGTPAPAFTTRVGVDLFDWFTPSIRLTTASPWLGHSSSWAVLAELRAHSRGRVQVNGGLSFGMANLAFAAPVPHVVATSVNPVHPYVLGDVGVRVRLGHGWIGFNIGGSPFAPAWMAMLNAGLVLF